MVKKSVSKPSGKTWDKKDGKMETKKMMMSEIAGDVGEMKKMFKKK